MRAARATPEPPPIPRTDPVWGHYALRPVCRDQCIDEVLFVADHLARAHAWDRDRVRAWVDAVRAGRAL